MIFPIFATRDDLCDLFEWMDGTGDYVFLEKDSRPDQPNRVYDRFPKVEFLAGDHVAVSAWVKAAGSPPVARKVTFSSEAQKEFKASGRTFLESPAILRFHDMAPMREGFIAPIEMFYETELTARKLDLFAPSQIDGTDWAALDATVNLVKRRLRATSAGKWKSRPVMPGVAETLKSRPAKLWYWGAEGTI